MLPDDFEFTARLLKDRSGLVLTKDKAYLLENRLMPVVRSRSFKSLPELVAALRAGDPEMQADVIDAMMAKDTGFFRDWKPFEHFRTVVLPNLAVARGGKRAFRILSVGVSTGQEAYSLAMAILDAGRAFTGWQIEILGVDISASAIAAAARGGYSQFDVQRGLPIRTLLQHFNQHDDAWLVSDQVRAMVKFQTWNLLDDLFPLGRFDVVLCRNVLVYFDLQTKLNVLQKLARLLLPDGALFLGLGETIMGVSGSFRSVEADLGIFTVQRADRPSAASLASRA